MQIKENIDLKDLNGLRVPAIAKYYLEVTSVAEIKELILDPRWKQYPHFILGGGMNTVFVKDFDGFVVNVMLEGLEFTETDDGGALVKVGAGYDWPKFIEVCVDLGYNGNENLADVPGKVGAAPLGNIACYGQTQEDTFVELEAINIETGELETIAKEDCGFIYRNSKFKGEWAGKYIITSVTYKLRKDAEYSGDISFWERYRSLEDVIKEVAEPPYDVKDIFNAVRRIRQIKLPNLKEYGSLGSTFMNPFVDRSKLEKILERFPGMQFYPVKHMDYPKLEDLNIDDLVKIPAGWIFEELGWRNKWVGNVGTYREHAMVIVSREGATSQDVINFIDAMRKDFFDATGIDLEPEIRLIGWKRK